MEISVVLDLGDPRPPSLEIMEGLEETRSSSNKS